MKMNREQAFSNRISALSMSAWLITIGFVIAVAAKFTGSDTMLTISEVIFGAAAGCNIYSFISLCYRTGRMDRDEAADYHERKHGR